MGALRQAVVLLVGGLALAAAFAGCGGKTDVASAPDSPLGGLELPGFEQVKSGELEVTLNIVGPREREGARMRLIGTFVTTDGEALPQVDFGAEASGQIRGERVDLDTALIATDDRAVLTYDGDTFETDRPTFEMLQASLGRPYGSGGPADLAACLEELAGTLPIQVVGRPAPPLETKTLEGTPLSITSADVEAGDMLAALRRLEESSGCGTQLKAMGRLRVVLAAVETSLQGAKAAETRLAVDKSDVVRELTVSVVPQTGERPGGAVEFALRLNSVNEVAELPPCYGERPLRDLIRKLGFNPLEPLETEKGGGFVGLLNGIFDAGEGASRA
jgi:hypothetical protein